MLHSGCPTNTQLLAPLPNLNGVDYLVGQTSKKAFVDISTNQITIDDAFLRGLDDDALDAVLYHELAHTQTSGCAMQCPDKPEGCERCADNRLGACLAMRGFSRERALAALSKLHVDRPTLKPDALAGFDSAHSSVRNLTMSTTGAKVKSPIVAQLPLSPFLLDPPFTVPDHAPPGQRTTRQPTPPISQPVKTFPPPTVNAPGCPCQSTCACDVPTYDFSWVVGLSGGVVAFAILATKVLIS